MSAFVVSQDHIAALVNAAERHARKNHGSFRWANKEARGIVHYELSPWDDDLEWSDTQTFGDREFVTHRHRMNETTLGQMLLDTCLRSVFYRYPNCETVTDLPGYTPDLNERGPTYKHNPHLHVTAVAALKAIQCYDYQSCEFPEWQESAAFAFCRALREALVSDLPGYDDAPWQIVAGEPQTQAVRV